MDEPSFAAAWEVTRQANVEGWPTGVPDVRWRARIALWAAQQALGLEGDFVECGVHTGLFSLVVCHTLDFDKHHRQFYLFDTFDGIPLETVAEAEQAKSRHSNENIYRDVFAIAERNFKPFKNAKLVRGVLPESLSTVPIDKIAYLLVDLNNAYSEKKVIEQLWDRIVPGAVIIIDDYLWADFVAQYDM